MKEYLKGHHPIGPGLWDETGLDPSLYDLWDDCRIQQPERTGHGQRAHGIKKGYSAHVKELLHTRLAELKLDFKSDYLTLLQQKNFMNNILQDVLTQPKSSFIGGFNDAVQTGGDPAVFEWNKKVGMYLPLPKKVPSAKIAGTLPTLSSGFTGAAKGGSIAMAVIDAYGTAETIQEGAIIASGREAIRVPYIGKDTDGYYHYEELPGCVSWAPAWVPILGYGGTDKVYENGERRPYVNIAAKIEMLLNSVFFAPKEFDMKVPIL